MLFTSTLSLSLSLTVAHFYVTSPLLLAYTIIPFAFSPLIFQTFKWETVATAPSGYQGG